MNVEDFIRLCRTSIAFLKVPLNEDRVRRLFDDIDKDCDNLITYQEYVQAIHDYFCRYNSPKPNPTPIPNPYDKRWRSNLRELIWGELRSSYDSYSRGKPLKSNFDNTRGLVLSILGRTNFD
jgi:hypothetical protein